MYFLMRILFGFNTLFRQLWLSMSSINFYKDVYKNYQGFGIKYLFTICFITSVIYSMFILSYILNLQRYFNEGYQSKNTENIDYIISQFPDIQYNNGKIFIEEEQPIYLYSQNKNKIVAIDTENQLNQDERNKIPIILTSNRIILNLVEVTTQKKLTTNVEYNKIFDLEPKIINVEVIKRFCANSLAKIPNNFIYLGVPIIIAFWFVTFLFEKSFIMLLIYILTNLSGFTTSVKTCIRLVIFASGIPVLLQPILTLLLPVFSDLVLLVQMFTTSLLFMALWQMKNNKIFR